MPSSVKLSKIYKPLLTRGIGGGWRVAGPGRSESRRERVAVAAGDWRGGDLDGSRLLVRRGGAESRCGRVAWRRIERGRLLVRRGGAESCCGRVAGRRIERGRLLMRRGGAESRCERVTGRRSGRQPVADAPGRSSIVLRASGVEANWTAPDAGAPGGGTIPAG